MNIKETITIFATDYYNSGMNMADYSAKKALTEYELTMILQTANVFNQPSERVRVKNLIEKCCEMSYVSKQKMSEIIEYRQADLINVLQMRRPLPQKNLLLLEKYAAKHNISL